MSEPPIPRPPAAAGADRLTGLDSPPSGVAPVLVQVLEDQEAGATDLTGSSDGPVAALRQSISAAGAQLGNLQALRQERDGLQERCQSLESELTQCRQALQQSQEQLANAHRQLAEVDALQRQLQQLLEPQPDAEA